MSAGPRALVLGSGIAGLTAALELARRGVQVEVIEAAPIPGGRTSSFNDAQGREVDTGLHVVADHYVNLIDVLASVGASRRLIWVEKHTYLRDGHEPMSWYFSPYQPPFHLLRPVREMPLRLAERAALGFVAVELASYSQAGLEAFDGMTYRAWHDRHRIGEGFTLELAEAAADAATFLTVEVASARAVLSWMKYLMRHRKAGDVGLFAGTLHDCLVAPLVAAIEALGGRVRTNTAVTGLRVQGRQVTGVEVGPATAGGPVNRADGVVTGLGSAREVLEAEIVVSALPVQALRAVLTPEQAREAWLTEAMGLTTTPAMSAIVWFDRFIEPIPEGAPLCTGCAFRDLIDLSILGRAPADAKGSVYQFVITRADQRLHDEDDKVVRDVVADLQRVWPGARDARPIDAAVERIGSAMFAAVPGAHALRPGARTGLGGLFLAGDWTRHEANASMEGAAISGRRAASEVLVSLGDLPIKILEPPDPTVVPVLQRLRQRLTA
jgi:15-cis-phytoene desaturase